MELLDRQQNHAFIHMTHPWKVMQYVYQRLAQALRLQGDDVLFELGCHDGAHRAFVCP